MLLRLLGLGLGRVSNEGIFEEGYWDCDCAWKDDLPLGFSLLSNYFYLHNEDELTCNAYLFNETGAVALPCSL